MSVKYEIFVSSTYEDLRDERNEVIKACLNMGHIPVGMEMFNAADEEQWAVIARTIDQCDYYVVIVAHRYGSTTLEGISFTEKEYDYAVTQGVPALGFIIDGSAPWRSDLVDKDQTAVNALKRFKSKVKQKMVRFWRDKSELQAHFAVSLAQSVNSKPRRGWIRAPEAADADVAQSISALAESVTSLKSSQSRSNTTAEIEYAPRPYLRCYQEERGSENLDGQEIFLQVCALMGSSSQTAEYLANRMNADLMHLNRFLNRLELLGALKQRLANYALSDVGGEMYRKIIAERELGS